VTKKEKSLLRYIMKNEPETSNAEAADECGCSIATVRKYRQSFAPKEARND
jgi:DNA-binding CsgD family transcriptional regulator